MRIIVWVLLGMGLLAWGRPSAGETPSQQEPRSTQGQVSIGGGRLSVSLREAEFRDVMAAIARQGGIKVTFIGKQDQGPVTESFVGLPLEDGLRRLLRNMKYAFVYSGADQGRRLTQIFVMSRSTDRPERSGVTTVSIGEVIRESFDTLQFAETVKAAIAAEGGTTQGDQTFQRMVAPELNTLFQRVLSGEAGEGQLADQFRHLADQVQQMLDQGGR